MSIRIARLEELSVADAQRLVRGYESKQRYDVWKVETPERTEIRLELVDLDEPFVKRWDHAERMIEWFRGLLSEGLSFGAWAGDRLVGLALTQRQEWNDTAVVWELHVEGGHRGRGIGRRLLSAVEDAAHGAALRTVMCETQTPNVAAIAFYRSAGYSLEGIDLSYYANDDVERGEVAVFMKKALRPGGHR